MGLLLSGRRSGVGGTFAGAAWLGFERVLAVGSSAGREGRALVAGSWRGLRP